MGTMLFSGWSTGRRPDCYADYNSTHCGSWHMALSEAEPTGWGLQRLWFTRPRALSQSILKGLQGDVLIRTSLCGRL